MITKLRRKFIRIAMLSLLAVMLLIVAAINIVFFYQSQRSQEHFINIIRDSGTYPFPPDKRIPDTGPKDSPENKNAKMPIYIEHGVVSLNKDLEITEINSDNISSVTEEVLFEYTDTILEKGRTSGKIGIYKYRMYEQDGQTLIIFLNDAAAKSSMRMVFLITLSVASVSYLLVFFLVVFMSDKAIRPIAESYEKQKQFITDAGHELKTPLTVISANTEIARMTFGQCEWFDGIDKQTNRMKGLVRNLISLTKMDEENTELILESFCISDALYDTAMTFKGLAESRNLTLNMHIENDCMFQGDESSLRQVFAILLDNAVKYCSVDGEISVHLRCSKTIVITIINTYSEINSIDLNRIFDRFYREDKSRASGVGYGLGLSIAKAVIGKHHGTLKASKIDGKDISFEITLSLSHN